MGGILGVSQGVVHEVVIRFVVTSTQNKDGEFRHRQRNTETRLAKIHVRASNESAYQERRVSYLRGIFDR